MGPFRGSHIQLSFSGAPFQSSSGCHFSLQPTMKHCFFTSRIPTSSFRVNCMTKDELIWCLKKPDLYFRAGQKENFIVWIESISKSTTTGELCGQANTEVVSCFWMHPHLQRFWDLFRLQIFDSANMLVHRRFSVTAWLRLELRMDRGCSQNIQEPHLKFFPVFR